MHRNPTEETFQEYAAELVSLVNDGGVLLDVGSGACQITTYLASSFEKIYAMDFSESMLAAARARIERLKLNNIELLWGKAQKFPEVVKQVNVVLSYAVAQSLSENDLRLHLQECHRVLAPGGVVCIGLVPDHDRRNVYYSGYFTQGRFRRFRWLRTWLYIMRRRSVARLKGDLMWDGVGAWFSKKQIAKYSKEAGFDAEFYSPRYYDYRFHVLLRRQNSDGVPS